MVPPLANAWVRSMRLPGLRTEQGSDPMEYALLAEGAEATRRIRLEVKAQGTGVGGEPLMRGQSDVWMTARPIRESDLEVLRKRNVPNVVPLADLQVARTENLLALGAIAVITSPTNPVRQLSLAQMKDIFQGRVTNWSQVGGPDMPISVHVPDAGLSSFGAVCEIVMGIGNAQQCSQSLAKQSAPPYKLLEDLADAVSGNPGAIGWVTLGTTRGARAMAIATECGGRVEADAFFVKADEYPLTRRYFVYTNPTRPPSAPAQDFLRFALSKDGQSVLRSAGVVDLLPGRASEGYVADRLDTATNALDGGRTRVRPSDARAFEEATQNATRLSITFRFVSGTDNLDTRAEADIERLAQMMKEPDYARTQLVLIGFSAARGDYAANRELSQDRARAVRDRLIQQLGVRDAVSVGVGPAAPVACNGDNAAQAAMNQRVEASVRKGRGS